MPDVHDLLAAGRPLDAPTTTGNGAERPRPELAAYAQVSRDVAERHGALLVDHDAHWTDRFVAEASELARLAL